jgi:CHAT domain-containing protein
MQEAFATNLIAPPNSALKTLALLSLALAPATIAHPASPGCAQLIEKNRTIKDDHWVQRGGEVVRIDLPPADGTDWLVRVTELGVDVEVAIEDPSGKILESFDSPIERDASQFAYLTKPQGRLVAVVTAKEPVSTTGTIVLTLTPVPPASSSSNEVLSGCLLVMRHWAAADAAYARGRAVELAHTVATGAATSESFTMAAQSYRHALAAIEALPSPQDASPDRAELELALAGVAYYELHEWRQSAQWAGEAAHGFSALDNQTKRARALSLLAAAWLEQGPATPSSKPSIATPDEYRARLVKTRTLLARLADFYSSQHATYQNALQVNNVGLSYFYEGRYEEAIPYFGRAQKAFERLGEAARLATALQNQALCEWGLGRLTEAVKNFDRAQAMMRPTLYPDLYLLLLNNSGLAHYAAGQFDQALRLQTEALEFASKSQSDRARARSHFGLALTYYAMGDVDLATRLLKTALEECPGDVDLRTRVPALRSLAVIEHEQGSLDAAIGHNTEALALANSPSARARILIRLADDYAAQADSPRALDLLRGLILQPPPGDLLTKGIALAKRGVILRAVGRLSEAASDLTTALHIFKRFDALTEGFEADLALARLRADQHREREALAQVREALGQADEIRAQTANPEYHSSIAKTLRPALDLELELLWNRYQRLVERGRAESAQRVLLEALMVVDGSRARAFDEWRAERLEPHGRFEASLATRSRLYHDMAERRFQLAAREDHVGSDDKLAEALHTDIAGLRARAGLIDAELARSSQAVSASSVPPTAAVASVVLKALPPQQAYLEYWLSGGSSGSVEPHSAQVESRAYVWVIAAQEVSWTSLGSSADIESAARNLHDAMRSTGESPRRRLDAATRLYGLIIAPVMQTLAPHRELIVLPDAALHYVPFAALRDSSSREGYLVQRFDVAIGSALRHFLIAPNGNDDKPARRGVAPLRNEVHPAERMLLVADPVYSAGDPRLTEAFPAVHPAARPVAALTEIAQASQYRASPDSSKLARLTGSGREAEQIKAIYGSAHVDSLIGLDATRENVLERDLAAYRFIHIASHGLIDSDVPQLSALALGRIGRAGAVADPYLRVSDVLQKTFNAQAVVLSACDTSLGKAFADEGVIGLRYAALARGARAVVASLWPVADGITANVMTGMYREMMSDARAPADIRGPSTSVVAAMSSAMRRALTADPNLDPSLWAPFSVYVAGRQ